MSQQHDPLASIDGNIKAPSNPLHPLSDADPKPAPSFAQESRQHQTLHQRLVGQEKSGKQAGNYVSPSDDIMSPASAKLNAFKEKRFAKSTTKPRTLFANTRSMSNQGSNKMEDVGTDAGREQRNMAIDEDAKMSEG